MAQVKLPKGYKPKKNEEYMSDRQLEYFRLKLLDWRQSLLDESQQTIDQMRDAAFVNYTAHHTNMYYPLFVSFMFLLIGHILHDYMLRNRNVMTG